ARNNPQDDAEVIDVPSRPQTETDFHNFRGVIDTGSFLQPNPSAFNLGFFDSFDDLFRRLRTRLWPVIATDSGEDGAPALAGSDDSSDDVGSGFSFGLRPLIPISPKNGNTTSTVKVVDGHKVEINETVYGDSNSMFKVRVVNVRPLDSGETVDEGVHTSEGGFQPAAGASPSTSAPPTKTTGEFEEEEEEDRREPLEKQPKDNEVRDIDEPQSTTTPTTRSTTQLATSSPADLETEATDISEDTVTQEEKQTMDRLQEMMANVQKEVEVLEEGEEEVEQVEHEHEDLQQKEREEFDSSDDEDAEATTPVQMSDAFNDEWAEFDQVEDEDQDQDHDLDIEADAGNELDNDIDIEENFVPVDLSNDIAVNDLAAADPNFPRNPDAEIFMAPSMIKAMPMFEKLSLEPSK
ncbi:hypothetical protein KR009_002909, partial [Drosophila setifemur]